MAGPLPIPGGPIWKGTVPTYKDAASFNQWFNDDPSVNKTFTATLEQSVALLESRQWQPLLVDLHRRPIPVHTARDIRQLHFG